MFKDDGDIREDIINDPRGVGAMLDDILLDKDSREYKAYLNPNDPLHKSTVKKVEYLMGCQYGLAENAPEVMPVVTQSGPPNKSQCNTQGQDII